MTRAASLTDTKDRLQALEAAAEYIRQAATILAGLGMEGSVLALTAQAQVCERMGEYIRMREGTP